jgi:hypothetical protein
MFLTLVKQSMPPNMPYWIHPRQLGSDTVAQSLVGGVVIEQQRYPLFKLIFQ